MLSDIHELNRLRVERDLTYERLAALIGVTPQALYRILNVPNPKVRDRTLYKIQKFLASERERVA